MTDSNHHEHQAALHLAAVEKDPDTPAAELRVALAQAHAALALSMRIGGAQINGGELKVVTR